MGRSAFAHPRCARGITFVEILVAVFVLAAVLLPIGALLVGGGRQSKLTESFNVGANIAANVMDQLLSVKVPFDAIDPEGGPEPSELGAASGLGDSGGVVTRRCAGFKPGYEELEERIFGSQGTPLDGNMRVVTKMGYVFEIYFFAGVYHSMVPNDPYAGPDFRKEMTFCFFKNPFVETADDDKNRVVMKQEHLDDPRYSPYAAEPDDSNGVTDPRDPRARPGWPELDDEDGPTFEELRNKGASPTLDYPVVFTDFEDFDEAEGGLMKIVIGVRWGPRAATRGIGSSHKPHEFWLVSMKARLEDDS